MSKFSELTKDMSRQQKIALVVFLPVLWLVCGLWLAGYIYLWKIGQPPLQARPWTVVQYWLYYGHTGIKPTLAFITLFSLVACAIPAVVPFIPQKRKLHGDAKLASKKELEKAGLFTGGNTWVLGRFSGRFLFSLPNKITSFILAAPPRSGKGVGIVQPNLFHLGCSVIVTDIRQEAMRITSGFRSQFSEVYCINPFPGKARAAGKVKLDEHGHELWEARTHRYNPFSYVPDDPAIRVNELQKIASFLYPDPLKGDPFWSSSARTLFLGIALYMFETPGMPRTLGQVYRLLTNSGDKADDISGFWAGVIAARAESGNPLSPSCVTALKDFISVGGNTLTSIRKSATAPLELFANPVVDAMTSESDFDLRDLRKRKMTIYIGVSPDNLERARPLLSLFVQQALDLNMQEMPEENPLIKHPVFFLLDEVTALGRIPAFVTTAGYVNGYWIGFGYIIQGLSQLRDVYGQEGAETIITCCQVRLAFAPKNHADAEALSKDFGTTTAKSKSTSRSSSFGKHGGGGSVSHGETARPLFLPQEIREIGQDKVMIFIENIRPIIATKILYYQEEPFTERAKKFPVVAPLLEYQSPSTTLPSAAAGTAGGLFAAQSAGTAPAPAGDVFDTPAAAGTAGGLFAAQSAGTAATTETNDEPDLGRYNLFDHTATPSHVRPRLVAILDDPPFNIGLADLLETPLPDEVQTEAQALPDPPDLPAEAVSNLCSRIEQGRIDLDELDLDQLSISLPAQAASSNTDDDVISSAVDKFFAALEGN